MRLIILLILLYSITTYCFGQKNFTQLNQSVETANEICISIHPAEPKLMAAAANINLLYTSSDSGKTWLEHQMKSTLGIWGDPVLLHDDSGYLYYAHLSRTPNKNFPDNIDRIVVQRSTNNGLTFNDGVGVGINNGKAQDKEWMSFDGHPSSSFYGNLYLSWTEFDRYGSTSVKHRSRIRLAKSSNRGISFNKPVVVSDSSGDCIDGDNTTEGATSTVTSDGTVLVAWAAFGKLFLDVSTDGGVTFRKDRIIAEQAKGWDMSIKHIYRSNGMPFLVSDQSQTSAYKNRVYICWADERYGDADIWLMHSDDKGTTWSNPLRVNKDSTRNGKSQFMPHICIDQSTGKIYIIYYDNRHSKEAFLDTYVAVSDNGGNSFEELRLTHATPAAGEKTFFGDYITIAAAHGIVRAAWTATGKNGPELRITSVDQLDIAALKAPYISSPFKDARANKIHIHVACGRPVKAWVQIIINGIVQPMIEVYNEEDIVLPEAEKGSYTIRLLSLTRQLLAESIFNVE